MHVTRKYKSIFPLLFRWILTQSCAPCFFHIMICKWDGHRQLKGPSRYILPFQNSRYSSKQLLNQEPLCIDSMGYRHDHMTSSFRQSVRSPTPIRSGVWRSRYTSTMFCSIASVGGRQYEVLESSGARWEKEKCNNLCVISVKVNKNGPLELRAQHHLIENCLPTRKMRNGLVMLIYWGLVSTMD